MIRFEVQRQCDLMRVEEREQLFQTENRCASPGLRLSLTQKWKEWDYSNRSHWQFPTRKEIHWKREIHFEKHSVMGSLFQTTSWSWYHW